MSRDRVMGHLRVEVVYILDTNFFETPAIEPSLS